MGYGNRAMRLLREYYECRHVNVDEASENGKARDTDAQNGRNDVDGGDLLTEKIKPRAHLPSLLAQLSERKPEHLHWMGTSFGLTLPLLKFWKKSGWLSLLI